MGKLYVADSTNKRVCVIDVQSGHVAFSSPSLRLRSCSALTVSAATGSVFVVDGFGLGVETWSPSNDTWSNYFDISPIDPPPFGYLSSVTVQPYEGDQGQVWLADPSQLNLYVIHDHSVIQPSDYTTPTLSLAVQYYPGGPTAVEIYILSQLWGDSPMPIWLIDSNGMYVNKWDVNGTGGGAIPFFGWAMHVDSNKSMYVTDHGVDEHTAESSK